MLAAVHVTLLERPVSANTLVKPFEPGLNINDPHSSEKPVPQAGAEVEPQTVDGVLFLQSVPRADSVGHGSTYGIADRYPWPFPRYTAAGFRVDS